MEFARPQNLDEALAAKADLWLRVRPGSDGALALGIAGVMIAEGWFDRDFVREWSNGPHLIRADNGRLLTGRDLDSADVAGRFFAWDRAAARRSSSTRATPSVSSPRPPRSSSNSA